MRVVVTFMIMSVMVMGVIMIVAFVIVVANDFAFRGEDGFRIGGVFDGLCGAQVCAFQVLASFSAQDLCVLEEFSVPEVSFRRSGTFRTTMRRREDVPFNGKRVSLLGQTAQTDVDSGGLNFDSDGLKFRHFDDARLPSSPGARRSRLRANSMVEVHTFRGVGRVFGFTEEPAGANLPA
jgi:hypothetical protein